MLVSLITAGHVIIIKRVLEAVLIVSINGSAVRECLQALRGNPAHGQLFISAVLVATGNKTPRTLLYCPPRNYQTN